MDTSEHIWPADRTLRLKGLHRHLASSERVCNPTGWKGVAPCDENLDTENNFWIVSQEKDGLG